MYIKDILTKKLDFDLKTERSRNINNHKKKYLSQEVYTNSQKLLPKINLLNVTNRILIENNLLSQRIKNDNKKDKHLLPPNHKFNIFIKEKNDFYKINPLKIIKKKENPKLNYEVYPNKKYDYLKNFLINRYNNYRTNKENIITKYKSNSTKKVKIKELKSVQKYNKENYKSKNTSRNENIKRNLKKIEKYKIKNIKSNSMFMTQVNFLNKEENNKENNIKEKNNINKENKSSDKKVDYDSLNFKELIKHLRNNRRQIIKNQNDINSMIKTTRDTYNEIWNFSHY